MDWESVLTSPFFHFSQDGSKLVEGGHFMSRRMDSCASGSATSSLDEANNIASSEFARDRTMRFFIAEASPRCHNGSSHTTVAQNVAMREFGFPDSLDSSK